MLKFPAKQFILNKCCVRATSNVPHINSAKDVGNCKRLLNFEDIPGPKSYPFIGTLHTYLPFIGNYDAEALDKNAWINWRQYGSLVREFPGVRVLHVFDPEDIEAVFRNDDRYPARRSHVAMFHYRTNKKDVYNTGGLLSTNGPDWWRLRSTFQKNFTSPQSVKEHVTNTKNIVNEFVNWIKQSKLTHEDDFLPYLNRLNLEVIGKVAFDEHFDSFSLPEQEPNSRSSQTIKAAFGSNCGIMKLDKGILWKYFPTPLYRKLARSQGFLEKVSMEIFVKKTKFFKTESNEDVSLLSSFVQQPNVDMKDVIGMMVDILMAAIDTTAYTTSFALYHISRNRAVQEKMFHEIAALLPRRDDKITAEVISNAAYVKSCLKESLRLNPVSIGVGRLTQKDFELRGYLIPKGTVIVAQNMMASRLPQYIKDPLEFKPERWLRGSECYEKINPFLSLPFGFGPRSCIARRLAEQTMTIIIMKMLREFEIKWMGEELGVQTLLINKPNRPISLEFKERK